MRWFDWPGVLLTRLLQIMKTTLAPALTVLISGCVGFGVLHEKTHHFENCSIRPKWVRFRVTVKGP